MVRVTNYLLACSMFLGIVMGGNSPTQGQKPRGTIYGYSFQCQVRGSEYPGACNTQNVGIGGGFRCDRIFCALPQGDGFKPVETGKAMDRTECRTGHWCMNGKCVPAGDALIPTPLGPGPKFDCKNPLRIRLFGTNYPPTGAQTSSASRPSTSTSSGTRTQNPSNRATVSPTPDSFSKRRRLQ